MTPGAAPPEQAHVAGLVQRSAAATIASLTGSPSLVEAAYALLEAIRKYR